MGSSEHVPVPALPEARGEAAALERASEIDGIRSIARTDPLAFEADQSLHARWLELVERQVRDRAATAAATARSDAQRTVEYGPAGRIVGEIIPELRREFVEDFRTLPMAAQEALLAELAFPVPAGQLPDESGVAGFAAHDAASAALAREWGARTAANLAVAEARIMRALLAMDARSAELALHWFEQLSPRSYQAVMHALVAGARMAQPAAAQPAAASAADSARDARLDAVLAELARTRAELAALARRPVAPAPAPVERKMRRVLRDSDGRIAGFEEY